MKIVHQRQKICQKAAISKKRIRSKSRTKTKLVQIELSDAKLSTIQLSKLSTSTKNLSKSYESYEEKNQIQSCAIISSFQIEFVNKLNLTSGLENFCWYSACQMERLMRVKQPSSQEKVDSKKKQRTRCQAKIFKLQVWILLANFPCFTNVID